jgi:H/ACA ribonucleoprotein complex subunit 1
MPHYWLIANYYFFAFVLDSKLLSSHLQLQTICVIPGTVWSYLILSTFLFALNRGQSQGAPRGGGRGGRGGGRGRGGSFRGGRGPPRGGGRGPRGGGRGGFRGRGRF